MGRMPDVGDIVDEVFRVEHKLDSGNFGTVYKVTDLLEKRTLALKVLRPGTHDEGELRKRFEREATLIYSLQHPHVVRVYYYGQTPTGLPYLAMEYLNGTDLRSLMHSYGQLHDSLAKRLTLETLDALEAAHAVGIVHRDLKPANIYLVNDGHKGHVKVLDFGFAKAFDDEDAQELTNAQTLVGTPAYMAPELVHKKDVGPASDLYAMGLILAEMVLGRKVIEVENVYDTILFQASQKPIKFPGELKKHPFYPVIVKACQKSLKKRYLSATEMMRDLLAITVEGESQQDTSPHMARVAPEPAPATLGRVYDDTTTRPSSRGWPSLEEVDAAMGHAPARTSSSYQVAAVRTHQQVARQRQATPQRPGAPQPLDSQHYIQHARVPQTDPAAARPEADQTLSAISSFEGHLDEELSMSQERPHTPGVGQQPRRAHRSWHRRARHQPLRAHPYADDLMTPSASPSSPSAKAHLQ